MRSALRGTAVMILLMMLLAPAAVQARTPVSSWNQASQSRPEIFLNKVWNLLAFWWENCGSSALSKNGIGLDPAGQPTSTSSPTGGACDNGSGLDPAGAPCTP
jgi:hypothetical protein